jgi:hypothetical protein
VRFVVVPSPSWPYTLYPHAHSVPSALMAWVWNSPPEMEAQSVPVPTCIGDVRFVVVPSPSWPK